MAFRARKVLGTFEKQATGLSFPGLSFAPPYSNIAKTAKIIRAVFKTTVESNYMIAIATLSDWLIFQPMRRKTKTNSCTRDFSRASSELHVIARNCDWFMELFVPVVIGQSDYSVQMKFH